VFDGLRTYSLKHAFVRLTKRAGITGLTWHDLRHEALSRFVERGLNLMEVCAISGHSSLDMLKRYTHLRAEDIAAKLG
jgi:site-specific recombinase XerD